MRLFGLHSERYGRVKHVYWTDKNGRRHRSLLRDNDPDDSAPQGVPADPPNVDSLNWTNKPTELHNELVNRGLFTQRDVQRGGDALTGAILAVFRSELRQLYRQEDTNG